jgi:hypothetical protein
MLTTDPHYRDHWGAVTVLGLAMWLLNDMVSRETGIRRFDLMFGSEGGSRLHLPDSLQPLPGTRGGELLEQLNEDLTRLRVIARAAHAAVIAQRRSQVTPETQNVYLPNELVLLKRTKMVDMPNKLSLPFTGPYIVKSQRGNDVEIQHMATHAITKVPVTQLKIFHGDRTQAQLAANQDYDQHFVDTITAWKGNPDRVTSLEFRVRFRDLEEVWLPYSKDISDTQAYGDYTAARPYLRHLAFVPPKSLRAFAKTFTSPITGYSVGDTLYVDLRCYGSDWYDQLNDIPDRYDKQYMLLYKVTAVSPNALSCYCAVFDEQWQIARGPRALSPYWCYAWGSIRDFDPDTMILVTPYLCRAKPSLISSTPEEQQRVLKHHFAEYR